MQWEVTFQFIFMTSPGPDSLPTSSPFSLHRRPCETVQVPRLQMRKQRLRRLSDSFKGRGAGRERDHNPL